MHNDNYQNWRVRNHFQWLLIQVIRQTKVQFCRAQLRKRPDEFHPIPLSKVFVRSCNVVAMAGY